ncbi:hypothetical protein GCM10011611_32190 [Aliidongia dinghuensis]|uniref:LTXXQ motif family protein n=1 Tax=Aliidongia dinghuensis TaxID=1867774 RepID=A0A8J2YUP0_9PROT|nr:Spy/CpxP family protein refolding chaperone [Aliidongia dinghuensis]GGF23664.1 hypothetical protein GCM10011611_32190 [Aliidongia dinghuensis]
MFRAFRPATRAVAAAALLSGIAVVGSALAQTSPAAPVPAAAPATPAPAAVPPTTSPTTAAAPAAAAPTAQATKHSARVEAHIADLKKRLKITDAESKQWDDFAQVMRDNGTAMETALQERDASKGISAVQDLQSYAKIAQTHADGVQKLAAAFQPLYDSLSPEQKKNADTIFEQRRHGRTEHEPAKKKS